MTNSRNTPRVDLNALEPTDVQRERVVGSVMAQLSSRPRLPAAPAPRLIEVVGELLPPVWIAAAAALLTAGSVVAVTRARAPESNTTLYSTVANWAAAEHVPSNAELLLAFQGYTR
jgi:hypothetical protein